MDVSLFDYHLPQELIAQTPAQKRDESRLLVINRSNGSLVENRFRGIVDCFQSGDVLVLNDTFVIPARLHGTKNPGSAGIEVLLLERLNETDWEVITSRAARLKAGMRIVFSDTFSCELLQTPERGKCKVRFFWAGDWNTVLQEHGEIPLPPYIHRSGKDMHAFDMERYQTVFAQSNTELNSAAAPTAGLHFTGDVLNALREKGVQIRRVTLRVGLDTFMPVRVDTVEEHKMHSETYSLSPETAEILTGALNNKQRIIAGGTTSVRVLESALQEDRTFKAGLSSTEIFIYPGYEFKAVSALLTNFHLPQSTLIMLVSAFMGNDLRKKAYDYAVQNRFRFYSYGDAMLIL